MLRILGSPRMLCDGIPRREMLRVGGLGMFSLGLGDFLRLKEAQAGNNSQKEPSPPTPLPRGEGGHATGFGQAKRIILLYLYGAASQHETYDPKPDAPAEIRGELNPIDTAVPGIRICEHLPELAKVADRVTFIRSMTHPYNIHSAAYTLTGVDKVDIPMELDPYDSRHWPFFGSVLEYLAQRRGPAGTAQRGGGPPPEIPRSIALPYLFSSRCPQFDRGGPYGGFLGRTYNPVWTEFEGNATTKVDRWIGDKGKIVADPYLGITPESRFVVSKAAQLPPEITLDRLDRRRDLLAQLEDERRALDGAVALRSLDRFQQMAFSLITSRQLREALDVSREPAEVRERYGMTLFGQATLAGRRLLEAGAMLVSVFWDEYDPANTAWDTHYDQYERLNNELLPGLDRALSSLILDLEARGMLDDTLILCLTEHGRTPKLSDKHGAGREHWSDVYCNLVAGGGMARGKVVGSSDKNGGFVKDDPVSPKDVLCTLYHLMGVDPHTLIPDRLGRPLPLVSGGQVLPQLLG